MKKLILALVGSLGMVMAVSTGAHAAAPAPTVDEGTVPAGAPYGYYIYVDGSHFRLYTHDDTDTAEYTGTVTAGNNGSFGDVDLVRQENDDWVVRDRNTLSFH